MQLRAWALFALVVACSTTPDPAPVNACSALPTTFAAGGAGHADPYGAKAAGQARAGRLTAATLINAPDARQKANVGDFVLVNDRIAVVIEDKGPSDGYVPFGGELIAVDVVGEDGRPKGVSRYGETLFDFAAETIAPESVSVLADGSDGKEAIVRVAGKLKQVPFLQQFAAAFGAKWEMPVAYDWVLAPGSSKVVLRVTLVQNQPEARTAIGLGGTTMGMFHTARAQLFTESEGFTSMKNPAPWLGYDAGEASYALRFPKANATFGLDFSSFLYVLGAERDFEACTMQTFDMAEVVVGGPGLDGLRQTIRATDGLPSGRAISGTVKEGTQGVAGVRVHAVTKDGKVSSRTVTDGKGAYVLHVPNETVSLVTYVKGYAAVTADADAGTANVDLALAPAGFVHVTAHDSVETTKKVPVRVQIIPEAPPPATAAIFGTLDEANGRLHQEFAVTGEATLPVPPGNHRVIVSRGYEWELVTKDVTVAAGATVDVDAPMVHSVDTTGVMCADFHIHSFYSADSSDPVEHKVKGAVADGLDAPFSSEHEWVVDFGPIVKKLGLDDWAFGGASEELTTFTWGHFGVIPLTPRPEVPNNGAVDWVGKDPKMVFGIVNALPEKPVLIVNHPRGDRRFEAYFEAAELDRAKATSASALWSDDFGAIEVTNDSSFDANRGAVVADWFALLGAGKTVWAVGSSDSHSIRTSPVGYPRTCLRFGHDDPKKLSGAVVRDVLRTGAATISGGLFMTVKGPNGEGPGETVKNASGTMSFTVDVASPTWVDATELEVIVDGVTTATVPLAPKATPAGRAWENVVTVEKKGTGRGFVVFHARGKGDLAPLHPGRKAFAYSNPVFF